MQIIQQQVQMQMEIKLTVRKLIRAPIKMRSLSAIQMLMLILGHFMLMEKLLVIKEQNLHLITCQLRLVQMEQLAQIHLLFTKHRKLEILS